LAIENIFQKLFYLKKIFFIRKSCWIKYCINLVNLTIFWTSRLYWKGKFNCD